MILPLPDDNVGDDDIDVMAFCHLNCYYYVVDDQTMSANYPNQICVLYYS